MSNKVVTNIFFVMLGMMVLSVWLLSDASTANEPKQMCAQANSQIMAPDTHEIAPELSRRAGNEISDPCLRTLRTLFSGTGAFDNLGG